MNESMLTDLTAVKTLIESVDLNSSIERLVKVHKWKHQQALAASRQYRNFIFLKKKYGKHYALPPSYDIDEFWHAHILHTQEYCDFCEQAFGSYLHHHPHHGKDNSVTDKDLATMFEDQTQKLYHQEFGEYIEAIRPLPFKVIMKRLWEMFSAAKIKSEKALAN